MRFYQSGLVELLPILLHAQTIPMPMDHHDHMAMPAALTQQARDQIAEAQRVATAFDTPEKARHRVLGPRRTKSSRP